MLLDDQGSLLFLGLSLQAPYLILVEFLVSLDTKDICDITLNYLLVVLYVLLALSHFGLMLQGQVVHVLEPAEGQPGCLLE